MSMRPTITCGHCGENAYPHPLWNKKDNPRIDWLRLETDIRDILRDETVTDCQRVARIDDTLAAHTRRGHCLQRCGHCGQDNF